MMKTKTLKKEIEVETKKKNYIPCSQIERIDSVEMFLLSKTLYRFNAISIKITMSKTHWSSKIIQPVLNYLFPCTVLALKFFKSLKNPHEEEGGRKME